MKSLTIPHDQNSDPDGNAMLAHACLIERHLNRVRDPHAVSEQLPRDRVPMLLVTARPYAADVRYRSISRPLVELIARSQGPATVTVLRPPTFDRLREHLRERPNHYHILHFDGHGGYGAVAEPPAARWPACCSSHPTAVRTSTSAKCMTRSIAPPAPCARCQLVNLLPVIDSVPCSVCHLPRSCRSRTMPIPDEKGTSFPAMRWPVSRLRGESIVGVERPFVALEPAFR